MKEITAEKIQERIREHLRKPLEQQDTAVRNGQKEPYAAPGGAVNSILWEYGTRYAKLIKKIPIIRRIAERHYWKLAYSRFPTDAGATPPSRNEITGDYNGFLGQLRHEGLKGRIKLFIFKFIGFFAWWQEQINRFVFHELHRQNTAFRDMSGRLSSFERIHDTDGQELSRQKTLFEDMTQRLALLEQTNKRLLEERSDIEQSRKEIALQHSRVYFAFEDVFRGPREIVKERQSQYLGYIERAYEQSKGSFLLDIGCGKGEFLELLSGKVPAKGIDINDKNIFFCRDRRLDAELADALQFLKSVSDETLIGITSFQVIEHLTLEYLVDLLRTSYQKIKPGGVIILETVNPNSLYSLRNFSLDLTHLKPIPPDTLKFLLGYSGFANPEVRFSSPVPVELKLQGDDDNTRKLNDILFGFQDYAVIAIK